jgi:aspartyl-tRNA(Asn)/glutamyl-tRNA(Gln) amidotransferase subunit A
MPLAFQLVGKPFDEAMILKIADAYQRDTSWHKARPNV